MVIKLYCLEKHRNNAGAVVEYLIGDELGDTTYANRKEIIELIKDEKYQIVNLQLDKAGRIVDKAVQNEHAITRKIKKQSESNNICDLFDRAYGFIQKWRMVSITVDSKGSKNLSYPFDVLPKTINIDKLQMQFEKYLLDKYKVQLTKLEVLNTTDNSRFIQYGLEYVQFTYLNDEDFKIIDSINNFKITCNANPKMFKTYRMVDTVFDKRTGKVINDAFLGIIVSDNRCSEAVDWTQQQIKKLEKAVLRIKRKKGTEYSTIDTLSKFFKK